MLSTYSFSSPTQSLVSVGIVTMGSISLGAIIYSLSLPVQSVQTKGIVYSKAQSRVIKTSKVSICIVTLGPIPSGAITYSISLPIRVIIKGSLIAKQCHLSGKLLKYIQVLSPVEDKRYFNSDGSNLKVIMNLKIKYEI